MIGFNFLFRFWSRLFRATRGNRICSMRMRSLKPMSSIRAHFCECCSDYEDFWEGGIVGFDRLQVLEAVVLEICYFFKFFVQIFIHVWTEDGPVRRGNVKNVRLQSTTTIQYCPRSPNVSLTYNLVGYLVSNPNLCSRLSKILVEVNRGLIIINTVTVTT